MVAEIATERASRPSQNASRGVIALTIWREQRILFYRSRAAKRLPLFDVLDAAQFRGVPRRRRIGKQLTILEAMIANDNARFAN